MEFRLSADASQHKTACNNPNSVKHRRNGPELEFQTALRFANRSGTLGGSWRTHRRRSFRENYPRKEDFRNKT
jgi:hypothetical protein